MLRKKNDIIERSRETFPALENFARSSKQQVSVTLVSDIYGKATHLFNIFLFMLLPKEGKKLSASQPCMGAAGCVQANMLLCR